MTESKRMRQPVFQTLTGVLFLLLLLFPRPLLAVDVPPLTGRVNDYAAILSPSTVAQLEGSLKSFEADQSTQIVVLTIPSLDGESLEDFSIQVADQWKIGQKGLDNGAILIIVRNDRKLRIEVGYGLEGRLTDLVAGRIIRHVIVPRFQEGNFNQGVIDGVSAMMAAVKGEFSATDSKNKTSSGNFMNSAVFLYLLFIIIFIVSRRFGRRRLLGGRRRSSYYIGGGGFGGSSGGFGGGGFSGGGGGFGGGGASGGW